MSLMHFRPVELLLAILLGVGCKPQGASESSAIVDAEGEHAIGLVALRPCAVAALEGVSDDHAENALRLAFALVECSGPKAASELNRIDARANGDVDAVTHLDAKVLVDGAAVESCRILGQAKLGAPAFVALFAREATTQAEFERQQAMWLAVRGRADGEVYRPSFTAFLEESFGAVPSRSVEDTRRVLAGIDGVYNPCVAGSAGPFDKTSAFSCVQGDYRLAGSFADLAASLSTVIFERNREFLEAAMTMKPAAAARLEGYETSLMVAPSTELGRTATRGSETPPSGSPSDRVPEVHPLIVAVAPYAASLTRVFGFSLGTSPHVPKTSLLKRLAPRSAAPSGFSLAGEAAAGSWVRAGNQWQWTHENGAVTTARRSSDGTWNYADWGANEGGGYRQTSAYQFVQAQNRAEEAAGWYRYQIPAATGSGGSTTYDYRRRTNDFYQAGGEGISYNPWSDSRSGQWFSEVDTGKYSGMWRVEGGNDYVSNQSGRAWGSYTAGSAKQIGEGGRTVDHKAFDHKNNDLIKGVN